MLELNHNQLYMTESLYLLLCFLSVCVLSLHALHCLQCLLIKIHYECLQRPTP